MAVRRIPLDLVQEILVLLPAKSVLRFKCVCKEWYNLIDSPLFTKLHLNKSLEPNSRQNRALICPHIFHIIDDLYNPLKWRTNNWPETIRGNDSCSAVGSCNGLVCYKLVVSKYNTATRVYDFRVKRFLICNPLTRPFKLILPSSEKKWTHGCSSSPYSFLSYGFGYDSEHDDYKIVVTSSVWTESDIDLRIYSLKADSWSYPSPPSRVSSGRRYKNRENVIFKDNTLHYLVSSKIAGDIRSQVSREYRIARFDVVSEKWRDDLYFPIQLKESYLSLGELDGQLYLRVGSESSDVWMLEEDGTWNKMFHLPKDFFRHSLIARSKDGHNRLLVGDKDLTWYDQRYNERIPFDLKEQLPIYTPFMLCITSLVKIPG